VFHLLSTYRYDSLVETDRGTATQAHRNNRGFTGPGRFLGDPVNAGDTVVPRNGSVTITGKKEGKALHVGVRARALVTENLHSDYPGGFGNTVVLRNSGSSTVSPVAISVLVGVSTKGLPP